MSTKRKESALTGDALAGLLHFLNDDPDRAAAEYERLRCRLRKLFRWRGCLAFDEYTDMAVDRVARMIAGGATIRTENPYTLFYGVAMNLLREHWRRTERERQAVDHLQRVYETAANAEELLARRDEAAERDHRLQCLRRCLDRLPGDQLALIERYYSGGDVLDKTRRQQIAGELKLSVNALRVRAHRIRSEVGHCVEGCLGRAATIMKWNARSRTKQ